MPHRPGAQRPASSTARCEVWGLRVRRAGGGCGHRAGRRAFSSAAASRPRRCGACCARWARARTRTDPARPAAAGAASGLSALMQRSVLHCRARFATASTGPFHGTCRQPRPSRRSSTAAASTSTSMRAATSCGRSMPRSATSRRAMPKLAGGLRKAGDPIHDMLLRRSSTSSSASSRPAPRRAGCPTPATATITATPTGRSPSWSRGFRAAVKGAAGRQPRLHPSDRTHPGAAHLR